MAALAKDSTVKGIIDVLTGEKREHEAKVQEIVFNATQFEGGQIDNTTGNNKGGSGFYRTTDFVELPKNAKHIQLFAFKPWMVYILYYDENKAYTGVYENTYTGYRNLKDYPYIRFYFYHQTAYMGSVADFLSDGLKIQYIMKDTGDGEHFLHNHFFNGNFANDLNGDGVGDGWELKNNPTSASVSDGMQIVVPSVGNYILNYLNDTSLTGHQVYFSFESQCDGTVFADIYGKTLTNAGSSKFVRLSSVHTATQSGSALRVGAGANAVGKTVKIRNIMVLDLTEVFGAGNEPPLNEIENIIDTYYGGYVPCYYEIKYDDDDTSGILASLAEIADSVNTSDEMQIENGAVVGVKTYKKGKMIAEVVIERDRFGNIVSVSEVVK